MRLAYRSLLAAFLGVALAAGSALAQDNPPPPSGPPAKEVPVTPGSAPKQVTQKKLNVDEPEVAAAEPSAQVGIGARGRFIFLPQSVLQLFLGHATSMTSFSVGGEVVRKKGNLDIVFGLEYANISPKDGLYLEKGKDPANFGDSPDYVHFNNFSMISLDGSFIWHSDLTDFMQLRYGAGIGVGFLLGDIEKQKTSCASNTTVDQLDDPNTTQCVRQPTVKNADKPPVVPIVNLLAGIRFKLGEQGSINLELGFRDVFFGGLSLDYFF
jgi:hypothetical protein